MTRRPLGRAALAAAVLMLAFPAIPATAQSPEHRAENDIPGIDIIVRKKPGGVAMPAGTSGRNGRFSVRVRVERGEYEVTTACRPRTPCPRHRLDELMVDNRRILPDAEGRFSFPIPPPEDSDSVRLSGRVRVWQLMQGDQGPR
ncbi:hypothetical protein [Brevundimonas sp.]|uniref:hypothetical protein n=1 Tax=Brevundimonas sp. TaxID=1871086 RepID=UPI002730B33C|nr:hypothetical protein [Brevundimonas sp.]MDP1914245.1 hypothetical protein [Brevundimonas sp.]